MWVFYEVCTATGVAYMQLKLQCLLLHAWGVFVYGQQAMFAGSYQRKCMD